jgi:hypothetical protein
MAAGVRRATLLRFALELVNPAARAPMPLDMCMPRHDVCNQQRVSVGSNSNASWSCFELQLHLNKLKFNCSQAGMSDTVRRPDACS